MVNSCFATSDSCGMTHRDSGAAEQEGSNDPTDLRTGSKVGSNGRNGERYERLLYDCHEES